MLQHKIAIIIPSTINANADAPQEILGQWLQAAKVKFARLFGGFTAHKACGGWVSQDHGLIEEKVTVVSSFTDEDGLSFLDDVRDFAARMADAMGQEAVSVEVDHRLEFVAPLVAAV